MTIWKWALTGVKGSFGFLQKIGKSLMLPVSVLPVAGILLGIGGALLSGAQRGAIHIDSPILLLVFEMMKNAGEPIFVALPLICAIGVALGTAKNDGVSALAAVVGYVVLLGTMGVVAGHIGMTTHPIMGIASIDTGVFGGIIVGVVAGALFNRFFRIELPSYLGFFAGKRFVPIVTALACMGVGTVLSIVWPPVQNGINAFSDFATHGNPGLAVFLYGFIERLLLPFGLHHVWNAPFFFQIGEFVSTTGAVVHGELGRFFAGDPTAGNLGGGFLVKMFGLPAAAIAIWHAAKPEHRLRVGSIMVSAALTSCLTGITEPIEFAFLFVAPVLYGIHALLAGLAFVILHALGAKLGYTFSQGFIDYALFFAMDTRPYWVLILGPVYAVVYYGLFRVVIAKLDLPTPGREREELGTVDAGAREGSGGLAGELVLAFGGIRNIVNLDACITRLRVGLADIKKASPDRLRALGASGVLVVGDNMQAIFGTRSEKLKFEMEEFMKAGGGASGADREPPSAARAADPVTAPRLRDPAAAKKAGQLVEALGGAKNLKGVEACAVTRLRVVLEAVGTIDEPALRRAGVQGIMHLSDRVLHLLIGDSADQVVEEMVMAGAVLTPKTGLASV